MDYDPMVMDEAETVGPVIKISQACCSALCCLSHLPLPSLPTSWNRAVMNRSG